MRRKSSFARRAGIIAIVALAAVLPASAQADVLANWGADARCPPTFSGIAVDAAGRRLCRRPRDLDDLRLLPRRRAAALLGLSRQRRRGLHRPLRHRRRPRRRRLRHGRHLGPALRPRRHVQGPLGRMGHRQRPAALRRRHRGRRRTAPSTSPTAGTAACRPSPPTATSCACVVRHGHDGDVASGPDLDEPRGVAVAAGRLRPRRRGRGGVHRPGRAGDRRGDDLEVARASRRRGRPRRLGPRDRRERTSFGARPLDGAPLGTLGSGSAPETQPGERLNNPAAVATDCRGAVYVADRSALRIHVFGDAGLHAPPCNEPVPPAPPAARRRSRPRAAEPGPRHQPRPRPSRRSAPAASASRSPARCWCSAPARRTSASCASAPSCRSARPSMSPAASCASRSRPRRRTCRSTARPSRPSSGAGSSASSRPPAARSSM